jgi:acetyl esterase
MIGAARARVYVPRALADTSGAAGLVFLHGGGFCLGSPESHDAIARWFADEVPCVVASIDYRLAPEHKFPAALDDAVAAFRWMHDSAAKLGVDPKRIAIGGDSAGGNLSASACHVLRDANGPMPAFQLLIYPATDMRCIAESHRTLAKGFLLEELTIHFFRDHYLRSSADREDPRASPLLAKDFSRLPPAMIVTAGFDPLRDEGREYADKLEAAGVSVVRRHDGGMFHGYFSTPGAVTVSKDALAHASRAMKGALAAD